MKTYIQETYRQLLWLFSHVISVGALDVLRVTLPNKKNQFGRNLQREKYLQFEMVENSEGKWKGGGVMGAGISNGI